MSETLAMGEWQALTNNERVMRCREFATEAERAAQSARPALQQSYEVIAERWLALAAAFEQSR